MFTDLSVSEFLDRLASKDAVPGGGSGSALGGALGAALVSMVCQLTIGKKGYEDASGPLSELLEASEALRKRLPELLEADTQVYGQVMAAYRLPRKTAENKASRREAMQSALKNAAEVPLEIAEACAQIVKLARPAAELGNKWAVSDAGVGALLAEACMHGALLNVSINLASINDAEYVTATEARIAAITDGVTETKDQVLALVNQAIDG